MKKLLTIALGVLTVIAQAEEVPAYLKDSVITMTLKNGKVYKFDGNEYKVVRRGSKAKLAEAKPEETEEAAVAKSEPARQRKNRVTLLGGAGFDGLNTQNNGSTVEVTQNKSAVFGLSLSRLVTDRVSLTGQVLSNETLSLGVGFDF